jgi:hypothetical protein
MDRLREFVIFTYPEIRLLVALLMHVVKSVEVKRQTFIDIA